MTCQELSYRGIARVQVRCDILAGVQKCFVYKINVSIMLGGGRLIPVIRRMLVCIPSPMLSSVRSHISVWPLRNVLSPPPNAPGVVYDWLTLGSDPCFTVTSVCVFAAYPNNTFQRACSDTYTKVEFSFISCKLSDAETLKMPRRLQWACFIAVKWGDDCVSRWWGWV